MIGCNNNHLQTLDRAITVATRMAEETLAAHLVLTNDHDRFFVLSADDFDAEDFQPEVVPDVVVHVQL